MEVIKVWHQVGSDFIVTMSFSDIMELRSPLLQTHTPTDTHKLWSILLYESNNI